MLVQDSMDILADNQRVQLENYISDKVSLLNELVTFPEIYEMDSAKQREFMKGRFKKLGFHHLFIMDKSGVGFYIEESVTRNQKGEPFFENVMQNEVYITEPFYGADATTMTISVWIHNKAGEKVGALCGAIELKDIQHMFSENRMFLNGENYLINRDGRYMSANDMQKVYHKGIIYDEKDSEVTLIREAFDECDDKIGTIIQNGVEYQTNVTYLKDFDWVIVQCIETEEIFKGLRYIDYWCYVALAIVLIIVVCVGCKESTR